MIFDLNEEEEDERLNNMVYHIQEPQLINDFSMNPSIIEVRIENLELLSERVSDSLISE